MALVVTLVLDLVCGLVVVALVVTLVLDLVRGFLMVALVVTLVGFDRFDLGVETSVPFHFHVTKRSLELSETTGGWVHLLSAQAVD